MNLLSSLMSSSKPVSGNFAGWMITFHKVDGNKIGEETLVVNSDQYDADLSAKLESGLSGGTFTFVIEGLSDDDYKKLLTSQAARLHLYWRDTTSIPSSLLSTAGLTTLLPKPKMSSNDDDPTLIAELALRPRIRRRTGTRHYEAVIEAEHWIFYQLKKQHVTDAMLKSLKDTNPLDAIKTLVKDIITIETYPHTAWTTLKSSVQNSLKEGQTLFEALNKLGELLREALPFTGHDLFVIRKGSLHVGFRSIPLPSGAEAKALTAEVGLVEAERLEMGNDEAKKPHTFRLTMRGYPDIQPGDVVSFDPPSEEPITQTSPKGGIFADILKASPLGSLGKSSKAESALLCVTHIDHHQGRTSGFVTFVNGVVIQGNDQKAWQPVEKDKPKSSDSAVPATSNEGRAAQSFKKAIGDAIQEIQGTEVGEVRKVTTKGSTEPPGQTVDVWRGLEAGDGKVNGTRRLSIRRKSPSPVGGVPYSTPFAWGKCGLVIPYYVGTRILMTHRGGKAEDPIVTGAVWESGKGPESKAGDWWLGLPVDVPENQRASIPESDTPRIPENLKASNDLIDGEGRRIIEVGEFIIRIGKKALQEAGKRPERKSEQNDTITIQHLDGECLLTLKADGTIILKGKKVEIEAVETITMKAKDVKISVQNAVDIS
jgi:hypothetical protein